MNLQKPNYKVIKSNILSTPETDKFICVSPETREILDDNHGTGYDTVYKAHAAFGIKYRNQEEQELKRILCRKVNLWFSENKKLIDEFDSVAFKTKFNKEIMIDILMKLGYNFNDLPFNVDEIFKCYTSGNFYKRKY